VFVGYRYYTTTERAVRYPFGHGLSYTSFAYEGLAASPTGPDTAQVTLTVRNTGAVAGADVVQVYVAPAASAVRRPVRELGAFARVHLEPGEARDVVLELERRRSPSGTSPTAGGGCSRAGTRCSSVGRRPTSSRACRWNSRATPSGRAR
jgi:hypothetical protein